MTDEPYSKNFQPIELRCKCELCKGIEPHRVEQWALDALQRIRDDVGFPLTISSAFRCSAHPDENRKPHPGTHNRGIAFDIAVGYGRERMAIIESALARGARGFGFGKTFLHIDFRETPATSWDYE